jgi:hypothetical protein
MACADSKGSSVLFQELSSAFCPVLMIDSMKAVTPNAPLEPFIESRVYSGRRGKIVVKTGIKDRNLWDGPQQLFHHLDTFELSPIVKGSKCRNACNGLPHFAVITIGSSNFGPPWTFR